jgi:hypothetical protein
LFIACIVLTGGVFGATGILWASMFDKGYPDSDKSIKTDSSKLKTYPGHIKLRGD